VIPDEGTSAFEIRLLGPVRVVRSGGEVMLGGPRQRAVLALLASRSRIVPAGQLAEELWGSAPPPTAAVTLRSYVSRLRSALAPDAVLAARGGGYVLEVTPEAVDAIRFERFVAAGHAALSAGDAAGAGGRFRSALSLWQGPALAGMDEVEPLVREATRLEELRLVAVEGQIEADIELGLHAEVAGELESLTREYPLRERLWGLLVLALYRQQRQADALAACRRARRMLASELGIEPGPELSGLEQAVLRQEVPGPAAAARYNLPAPLTSFVGRGDDLGQLDALLDEARLITLTGTAGTGKTRLAIEAGTRAAGRFADGVWLTELAGLAEPRLVAGQVMETLGVRQQRDVPVLDALVYRLRSASLLLILDNCEHLLDAVSELAYALLRAAPGLRVLATSREPVGCPGEVIYQVPPLALTAKAADMRAGNWIDYGPAVRLFLDRGTAARGGRPAASGEAAARVCRRLDGLPLAIELAAARLATMSAAEVEAHLGDRLEFLAYPRPVGDRRHQALRTALDWSYDLLSASERRFLADLSVFAGTFGLTQTALVCCEGDPAAALDLADSLTRKSLVSAEPADDGTRYRLLDTVRHYAADRLAETGAAQQVRRRHATAFLSLAEREQDPSVLARDLDNFRAALEWSLECGDPAGPRLARALGEFWLGRGLLAEGRDWLERALAAGRPGSRQGARDAADEVLRTDLLRSLGTLLLETGDLEHAESVLAEGVRTSVAAGSAASARFAVLLAEIARQRGAPDSEALAACESAAIVLDAASDLSGLAEALTDAGKLRMWLGDMTGSHAALNRAIDCAQRAGHRRARMRAAHWLAVTFHLLPIPVDDGITRTEELLRDAAGDPWAEADMLKPLCVLYAYAGRDAEARAAIARSQEVFRGFGAQRPLAESAIPASLTEFILGDPAAAERYAREGSAAFDAMGDHGGLYLDLVGHVATALYAQGRFDEAQRYVDENQTDPTPLSPDLHLVEAKLLARRGQPGAARELLRRISAIQPAEPPPFNRAELLEATAEVERLAGELSRAEECLAAALRIYQERRAPAVVARLRSVLAGLRA
jgi:predicted ATPase/DNA-binding SARP family transcriptional activator